MSEEKEGAVWLPVTSDTLLLSLSTRQEDQRAGRTAVGGGDKAKIKDKFNFQLFLTRWFERVSNCREFEQ